LPQRDPQAKPEQLDLTLYYNASLADQWHAGAPTNLNPLPRGLQVLAGVQFDVRGLIQVGTETATGEKYPKQILDISVGRQCKRLHFLHAAINASARNDGMQIGSYVIHYLDGQERVIPLIIGHDLADWWSQPNEENKRFVIAWKGHQRIKPWNGPPYPLVQNHLGESVSGRGGEDYRLRLSIDEPDLSSRDYSRVAALGGTPNDLHSKNF
jgi:hypothetical protein